MAGAVVIAIHGPERADSEEAFRRAAAEGGRTARVRWYHDRQRLQGILAEVEVLLGHLRRSEVALAPRLRWVQAESAGVDGFPLEAMASAHIVLTNCRGIYAQPMAEHALALLLAMTRGIDRAVRDQAQRTWRPGTLPTLEGRRLGILGLGGIGEVAARLGAAFGMEVWATRRHPAPARHVARVLGPSRVELLELLAACDAVIALLPSTPETQGIIDAEALAAMRPGSYLVNLGRGDLIVEDALDAALRSGHLAGAGLDTPPRDPLPADAPLWSAPGVLITPHVGGSGPDNGRRIAALFAANLTRYCRGEPLENVVDLKAGY